MITRLSSAHQRARAILRRLRHRWQALPVTSRPGLQPGSIRHLLSSADIAILHRSGHWPLTPADQAYIRAQPARANWLRWIVRAWGL